MNSVAKCLEQNRIIVIVRRLNSEHLIPCAEAMYRGGIRIMEIPFDTSGRFAESEVLEQINTLRNRFGNKIEIGAGTVLTEDQVIKAKEAGASFIISPNTDVNVISKTKELGLISIPGAMTPTEIQAAHLAGADFVKVFPSNELGPGYMRTVLSPLAHVKAIAVGGIDERNIIAFRQAGAYGFGVGSAILARDAIADRTYEDITLNAKRMIALAKH